MLEAKSVIGGQGVRDDIRTDEPFLDASSDVPSGPSDDRRRDGRPPFKIQTCRFFLQGICKKGEQCTYLHGGETPRERGPPPRERRPSESEWSAGDWECRKCGQHNFSKRATCFRCEAEKDSPDRRGPPSRAIRQAEDELREAEILLKTAQGEGNVKNISLAEEAIGRAMLAVKRARERDDEERRDRRGPPRDYRGRRSRSPPRYGFRDRSRSPRDFRDRSPPRGYRDRWSDRGWGPDQDPSWGAPYPPHGSPASYPSGGRPPHIDSSYDSHSAQGRWEETVAPNGDKYYWHTVTKETSWTDPRVTVPPASTSVPVALNWEVAMDENGDKYYWHTVTGATQWEPPPGFVEKSNASVPAATARSQQYPPRLNAPTASALKGSQTSRGIQRLG